MCFWMGLVSTSSNFILRVKRHLEPLAIAANITQASFCRLDTVLLTFGFLLMQYNEMTEPDDREGCCAIVRSLERRWAVADQEIFIAAVILNPFYQCVPFTALPFLNNAGIHTLFHHLWRRFYGAEPPQDFHPEVTEYLTHRGRYANLKSHCDRVQEEASRSVRTDLHLPLAILTVLQEDNPDPLNVYVDFSFPGKPQSSFLRFVMRILNICANSATCERLWSVFGLTLTKLRSRLGTSTLTSLGELKMHIRDEHMRKETKKRMKRLFASRLQTLGPGGAPAPVLATDSASMGSATGADLPASPVESSVQADGLRGIVETQTRRIAEDETDREPVTRSTIIGHPISLSDLFDFSQPHWVQHYENAARRSFDEELEMYELLDLDAAGEEEVDVDLDDSTGDLMSAS